MRLTIRTNLAMRILMMCGVNDALTIRTAEIAEKCNASPNHLSHVIGILQSHGYIETIRGRTGGLRLAMPCTEISIGQVFRLFEAGIPLAECFDERTNTCPLSQSCRLRTYIAAAIEAFYRELDAVTLAELVRDNCGLETLLRYYPAPEHDCRPATCP